MSCGKKEGEREKRKREKKKKEEEGKRPKRARPEKRKKKESKGIFGKTGQEKKSRNCPSNKSKQPGAFLENQPKCWRKD
jgi:hypothetical protein